jgi:hypothetical protein
MNCAVTWRTRIATGVAIEVSAEPTEASVLRALLPPVLARPDVVATYDVSKSELRRDGELLETGGLPDTSDRLFWEITQAAVASLQGRRTALHASHVDLSGLSLLFCGRSGSGKTTLAAAFGGRGGTPSDEVVLVADDVSVEATELPLRLRFDQAGWAASASVALRASSGQVHARWTRPTLEASRAPAALFVVVHEAGADCSLEKLTAAEVLRVLIEGTFEWAQFADLHLPRLAQLADRVPAWRVTYADADDAASAVIAAVGASV